MDYLSSEFLSALLAIIVIDLMLAGDNAIVIALAARNVPKHLQRRAIVWGMFGAIGVRIAMTLIVVWLLKIPGLLGAGGVLLVWIAYKLLLPDEHGQDKAHMTASNSFWGAMRTIVVADAIMGLDNVLAVAGAAHGSFCAGGCRSPDQYPDCDLGQWPDPQLRGTLPCYRLSWRGCSGLDRGENDRQRTSARRVGQS